METYNVFHHTPVAIVNNWQRPRIFHAPTWEQALNLVSQASLPGHTTEVIYNNTGKVFNVWYNKDE